MVVLDYSTYRVNIINNRWCIFIMDETIKLGIAIPYYRTSTVREVLMKELINYLKSQCLLYGKYLDICIVEDGSSSPWLEKEVINTEHFNYIKLKDNHGISYARNKAMDYLLDERNCDYLVLVDSDDYLNYDYIKKVLTEIHNNPRYYYFTDFEVLNDMKKREGLKERVTGIIYHKSILKNNRFDENLRFAEDVEFGNRCLREVLVEPYYIDTVYHYNYGIDKKCLSYQAMIEGEKNENNN